MIASRCYSGCSQSGAVVIHWKLAVMMAERDVSNKELTASTGMSPNSISRLKVRRYLTRIDQDTLNALCKALSCQPGDLLVYEKD